MKTKALEPSNGGGRRRGNEETAAERDIRMKKAAREAAIAASAALEVKRQKYLADNRAKEIARKLKIKTARRQAKEGYCPWCAKEFGIALKIHMRYCTQRPSGVEDADVLGSTTEDQPRQT